MSLSIRDRLLGGWVLVTFEATLPGGRVVNPMGKSVTGTILYSDNGLVSVNLARGGRERASSTFWHAADDAITGPLARAYMAYSGRFEVDESRQVARHHFDMCLDPALIGTLQERHVRFEGDTLELSVIEAAGSENPGRLLWRRPAAG
jgi:hypothetical protein